MEHETKRLGQHFLKNQSAIKKIVAALDLQPNDTVIEIGPGKGALTFPLISECAKNNCKIIAVEKDQQLAKNLEYRIQDLGEDFKIISGDALKLLKNPKSYILNSESYKVVGNIPYYITGKLLRILSELENKPALIVLMVQKEVAQRIAAKPPKMNLLAAAVQFWAEPKILFNLKPNDFNPPPEVESAVIKLESTMPTGRQGIQNLESRSVENYYKLIKILFKQPRKTLFNNLKTGLKMPKNKIEAALKSLKISQNSRPQNLSLKEIKGAAALLN